MRAAVYHEFNGPISVEEVDDPSVPVDGVIIEIKASGLCRSDLFAWHGNDRDLKLPHVPGHELAGVVAAVGTDVSRWREGDRVTAPFCCGCGMCFYCASGNEQICNYYYQPGFTHWGSFAQYCAIPSADVNVGALPQSLSFEHASVLGCRMITAYRALVERARLAPGEWLAVHGCGGLGLSMVMIGVALEARVVAVDIDPNALAIASAIGAEVTVVAEAGNGRVATSGVRDATGGGAHVSVDALGHPEVAGSSVRSLRKQGRHIQAGLLEDSTTAIPLALVVAKELEVLGTKGMSARRYPDLMDLLDRRGADLGLLVNRNIPIDELPGAFGDMASFSAHGITVVNSF